MVPNSSNYPMPHIPFPSKKYTFYLTQNNPVNNNNLHPNKPPLPSKYNSSPVSLTSKSSCHASPVSFSFLPPEIDSVFKFPVDKHSFEWNVSHLSKDELNLKMAKLRLRFGLPENMPKGDIKCPVCMIAQGTRTNHCKEKNLLNCLQLTCRKSQEASVAVERVFFCSEQTSSFLPSC
ncbi:uncharacterized protein VP01_1966g1 [Puccinia sorghi]|uniref:Uncharacterized protein n=1 Tax=Puccinia sorghi TaxID=27349 RepID=A0A0L6VC17_9BASI|nr:uncharacterized protein VP01_1966g1 [Puccinia sorghi]